VHQGPRISSLLLSFGVKMHDFQLSRRALGSRSCRSRSLGEVSWIVVSDAQRIPSQRQPAKQISVDPSSGVGIQMRHRRFQFDFHSNLESA